MNWRRVGFVLLALAVSLITFRLVYFAGSGNAASGMIDPAVEFYTRTHGTSYGGIDRWAYYGMRAKTLARLLGKDGYVCAPAQIPADRTGSSDVHEMACDKKVSWPLPRTLTIKARIEYGTRDRLVAASAHSILAAGDSPVSRATADVFRKIGWLEPENLQVKGFEIDTVDTLIRLSVDALKATNWHHECTGEPPHASRCPELAKGRRASGFPPPPQEPIAVRNAKTLASAMEHVHLMPLVPRGADGKPEDSLIVRLTDGVMWADFVGKDLAGRDLAVSIALDSEGGAPVRLVAKAGANSREISLAGERRVANDGTTLWLLPEAGLQNLRFAIWLTMPTHGHTGALRRLADAMPGVDPAFTPRMIKAMIGSPGVTNQTEENLGLYPALRSIEQRADALRLARVESWLSEDRGRQFVRAAYADDPLTRAAWALAVCESAGEPPVIDTNCWMNFVLADAEVTALLRQEVSDLQALYLALEPAHPVLLRLKRLGNALPSTDPS